MMKNRFNKIFNLYKISNMNTEEPNLTDEDLKNWNDLIDFDLYDDPALLRSKWEQFIKNPELKNKNLSKDFKGFSDWIDNNIPSTGSFTNNINSLIQKVVNFSPRPDVKKYNMTGVPKHLQTVAQPKEAQQPFDYNRWKEEIGKVESGGNYKATNKDSNALGKFQFVPSIWWRRIQAFSPKMKTYSDFLNDKGTQEAFMESYTKNNLLPELRKIRQRENSDLPECKLLSDGKLMALFHFQGPRGAVNWIKSSKMIGADINLSVPDYLKRIT